MMMGDAERWCPWRDHSVDESDIRTGRGPYGGPVRWSSLFADLESQLQAAEDQERLAAVPEVTRAAPDAGPVMSRLTLGHALRAVARDRAVVRVRTDGGDVVGRVDGVGRDHVDVTRVHPDSLRPTGERCAVPWSALLLLSRL